MNFKNYTKEQLFQFVEETADCDEMSHALDELVKRLSNDQLVQFIEEMVYYDIIPYALNELMERSSTKAFYLGIDILLNDKGDHFLQACVWSTCYDYNEIQTVTMMSQRIKLMKCSLIESVLLSMYNYEADSFPSAFKNLIINSYNDMLEEKKVELLDLFNYFLKKW